MLIDVLYQIEKLVILLKLTSKIILKSNQSNHLDINN